MVSAVPCKALWRRYRHMIMVVVAEASEKFINLDFFTTLLLGAMYSCLFLFPVFWKNQRLF